MTLRFGPAYPELTYVRHEYPEHLVGLDEIEMNFSCTGPAGAPAMVFIPGQSESWWGFEPVMRRLEDRYRLYAVDLRGQGRSSRTPGGYQFDKMGRDLVQFLERVVGEPAIVAGFSSGGVLAAWLSAYAPDGLVRGAFLEDPPLSSEPVTNFLVSLIFEAYATYLGDQWSIGDWAGFVRAVKTTLPPPLSSRPYNEAGPPQTLKEYDPEWARASIQGQAYDEFDRRKMLRSIRTPVLMTHHARGVEPMTSLHIGAITDGQAAEVADLIKATGNRFDYLSFPQMGHFMHTVDPDGYVGVLEKWAATLGRR